MIPVTLTLIGVFLFAFRYYLPFAESAIRYFFALGFVPWRLRRISSGNVVPEVVPLGMFTWSIDSITNRIAKGKQQQQNSSHARNGGQGCSPMEKDVRDTYQAAAEKAFQKQRQFFSDPKRVPYPLQGDVGRMQTRRDAWDEGKQARHDRYAQTLKERERGWR